MVIKKLQMMVLSCVLSANAFAGGMATGYENDGWPFIATLSLGPAWARPGETQTLTLQTNVLKTYAAQRTPRTLRFISPNKGTDTLVTGELFLGLYGAINSVVQGQIGLALALSTQAKLRGSIYEDANPHFNNYTYSYQVRNSRVALKVKTLVDPGFYDLLPYLSGSAGAGYNHAASFEITPVIAEEVPAPVFTDHTSTVFSYTLGVGLETVIDPNWRVGIGYEYAGWGISRLGPAQGQIAGSGLHLSNIRAQELQISLSYLA